MFWNINKKNITKAIGELCEQENVDLLILAESSIEQSQLLKELNSWQKKDYQPHPKINQWLSFYSRSNYQVKLVSDLNRIAIRQLINPANIDINIVALHLPSKLYRNSQEQLLNSVRIADIIRKEEQKNGHNRTLVIGDFNMNPFEDGMIAAEGFNSVMTPEIAKKQTRKIDGIDYLYFYNPMWQKMGNISQEAPGTYYYSKGSICYFWNTFDQVLLRPDLIDYFSPEQLKIITKIGNKSLLANHKISKQFSDHLPITISLNLNRRIANDY